MTVSAVWHGVYAGYYLCLMTAPMYLPIEDTYVKIRRDTSGLVCIHFVLYDSLTFIIMQEQQDSGWWNITTFHLTMETSFNSENFHLPPTKVFPEDNCFGWSFAHSRSKSTKTSPETIVFREANYLSWRLLKN